MHIIKKHKNGNAPVLLFFYLSVDVVVAFFVELNSSVSERMSLNRTVYVRSDVLVSIVLWKAEL